MPWRVPSCIISITKYHRCKFSQDGALHCRFISSPLCHIPVSAAGQTGQTTFQKEVQQDCNSCMKKSGIRLSVIINHISHSHSHLGLRTQSHRRCQISSSSVPDGKGGETGWVVLCTCYEDPVLPKRPKSAAGIPEQWQGWLDEFCTAPCFVCPVHEFHVGFQKMEHVLSTTHRRLLYTLFTRTVVRSSCASCAHHNDRINCRDIPDNFV